MALHLNSSIADLPGLGSKGVSDLHALGIACVRDLLWYLPFRYDDYSRIVRPGEIRGGGTVTVIGVIRSIESRPARNGRIHLVEAVVGDETGELKVRWFNQSYLVKTLPVGLCVSLAGRVDGRFGPCLLNPIVEKHGKEMPDVSRGTDIASFSTHTGRIVPVYGLTGSLTMRRLRNAVHAALPAAREFSEWLPTSILEQESYPSLADALHGIHFPNSHQELDVSIQRLKFDELFLHQLMFARVRADREKKAAISIPINLVFLKTFIATLPFNLTHAQRRAIWEIMQDLESSHPMNRLLEGDVGSGKTIVAAAVAAHVLHTGLRVAYLAPTEILASQQHETLYRLLHEPVALLTGTASKIGENNVPREQLIESLPKINCVVGTHALLQKPLNGTHFGLIIVDEQHRFGVEQRHALIHTQNGPAPHLLSMSATPIPRTLALTIYGDLELSILDEMPIGRKPVATAVVFPSQQEGMWKHVREQITFGRQVFVVCPLIDSSDVLGVKSVSDTLQVLTQGPLHDVQIGSLHGRLKIDEKEGMMRKFRDRDIDVLVSTTVVEVGVDIPNASVMVVMGAERFGLAQLHQLRGRVGRGDVQSYCYLLTEQFSGSSEERLRAMEQTNNGFELAKKDLELRGPGNIFGNAQSGFPDFQLATPADMDLMKKAGNYAVELLHNDPDLTIHPLIRERVEQQFETVHLE